MAHHDLTVVYYTANHIPDVFAKNTQNQLLRAIGRTKLISVSKKPMNFGAYSRNIYTGETARNHAQIYRQALIGAIAADTKYIALCEDDVLYSPEHFKKRPKPGKFAYNLGCWSIYTWGEPMFTYKGGGRKNLCNLICERELFIEAMEERFAKYPNDEDIHAETWAEPGKYEKIIGVTVREFEEFYTNPPNVMFSHQTALQYDGMGERKRLGEMRAYNIPYWGEAKDVRRMYQNEI